MSIKRHVFKGSSAIVAATYDTDGKELELDFVRGASYTYQNVPEDVYEALIQAPSAGQFFASQIKTRY